MNKIIFVLSIILLTIGCKVSESNSYKSDKTDEILDGIFELRLGMSEAELKRVVNASLLHEEANSIYLYTDNKRLTGRIKIFRLEWFMVNSNYIIRDLTFKFLDDKLYNITIWKYDPRIEAAFTRKFGKPKQKKKTESHIEYKTYAERTAKWDNIKYKFKTTETQKEWKTNDKNIICYAFDAGYYYLTIEDDKANKEINNEIINQYREEYNDEIRESQRKLPNEIEIEKKTYKNLLDSLSIQKNIIQIP